jgi:hypothetical protein
VGVARKSIPQSHVASTMPQVHYCVQLGVQEDSGNCDHRVGCGSRQEVSEGAI